MFQIPKDTAWESRKFPVVRESYRARKTYLTPLDNLLVLKQTKHTTLIYVGNEFQWSSFGSHLPKTAVFYGGFSRSILIVIKLAICKAHFPINEKYMQPASTYWKLHMIMWSEHSQHENNDHINPGFLTSASQTEQNALLQAGKIYAQQPLAMNPLYLFFDSNIQHHTWNVTAQQQINHVIFSRWCGNSITFYVYAWIYYSSENVNHVKCWVLKWAAVFKSDRYWHGYLFYKRKSNVTIFLK